jgi:hypothetical protein
VNNRPESGASSVSSQRTYKQILLESTVDQLPVSFLNVIFALPIAAGKPLKNQIDVMRRVAKELFSLGVQDAQSDAVSSRNDLLSVLSRCGRGRNRMVDDFAQSKRI